MEFGLQHYPDVMLLGSAWQVPCVQGSHAMLPPDRTTDRTTVVGDGVLGHDEPGLFVLQAVVDGVVLAMRSQTEAVVDGVVLAMSSQTVLSLQQQHQVDLCLHPDAMQEAVVDDVVLAMNSRTVLCSHYGSVSVLPPPGLEASPSMDPPKPP
eukprot:scaffold92426_cov17-Tisochrysis_lutea.AAC.2